jgi:hypothetical protein
MLVERLKSFALAVAAVAGELRAKYAPHASTLEIELARRLNARHSPAPNPTAKCTLVSDIAAPPLHDDPYRTFLAVASFAGCLVR